MRVARFRHGDVVGWGVVDETKLRVLAEDDLGVEQLFGDAPGTLSGLADRATRVLALDDVQLLAPVPRPSKLIAIGLNYRDHAIESNLPLPSAPQVFAKFPSSVSNPGDAIVLPRISGEVDWEVELVIVIGRFARHVTEDRVLDHVAGYTVGNDVSARDLQIADGLMVRAKSFDTFSPMGPWITTVDELGAADDLRIGLEVNGRAMQDSRTSEMVFGVRELVSYLSAVATLLPGDVIFTGTPHGTGYGMDPRTYLKPGDEVAASIEGIGTLRNPVVADDVR